MIFTLVKRMSQQKEESNTAMKLTARRKGIKGFSVRFLYGSCEDIHLTITLV